MKECKVTYVQSNTREGRGTETNVLPASACGTQIKCVNLTLPITTLARPLRYIPTIHPSTSKRETERIITRVL